MCGNRTLPVWSAIALVAASGIVGAATSAQAQYHATHRPAAPQGDDVSQGESQLATARSERSAPSAVNRSLYAKQGQFAARTTNYAPAWRVHPKVRNPQPSSRSASNQGIRQVRHQQEILEPPFDDEESAAPPFGDDEGAAPFLEEVPAQQPASQAPAMQPEAAPEVAPAQVAPRANGRRGPTVAPPRMEEDIAPGVEQYEELPAPRGMQRAEPDFDYEMTEQYGPATEEYGGEYAGDDLSSCPDCGQVGQYCECGPPNVCDDTWPCWHARRQWRGFRLFGGGWDLGCPWNWWDELSVFAGPQSFNGPLDQGQNGNFGFHEGVNWGGPLWHFHGIGFQLGAEGVHSNFAGDNVNGASDDTRNQTFATAGIFARAPGNHGWQIGVAFDWLDDNYYVDVSLSQIRAELSYVTFCGTELGGWIASSSETEEDVTTGIRYEVTDMYAFFFRHSIPSGGDGRIWGGGTADGNGLIGADFRVPLTHRWAISGAVNYVIPQDGASEEGLDEEAWGMTLNLVWHPFRARSGHPGNNGPYRPLFNVADNTMFMVDRETGE